MQSKLTLRLEKPLIDQAKLYAENHGKSLSQIVADYFKVLTAATDGQAASNEQPLPPITASLIGVFADVDATEDDYYNYLEAKHA